LQQQAAAFNLDKLNEKNSASVSTQLTSLYQQLIQFHLALEMQLDKSVLNLSDINLVDEIHATLFNNQKRHQ